MRLVVVAGVGSDARPAHVTTVAHGAQGAMEPRELGERLRTHADGLVKDATEVPLAHAEVDRDGAHAGARQPVRGVEHEPRVGSRLVGRRDALGDRALQDGCCEGRRLGVGEAPQQPSRRRVSPQVFERDDAPRERRGRHAEDRLVHAQPKTRRHGPLPAANELTMRSPSHAHRMDVEAASRRRAEANDELDLRTRDRDERRIVLALEDEQRRHGGRGRHARRETTIDSDALVHETIVSTARRRRKLRRPFVRFFQSEATTGGYGRHMKILVTGATGKVGSRLGKRLAQRGDQVRALVRDLARAGDLREARIELVQGDLLDAGSLAAAVRGVDAVVHCAAFFRGATPEQAHAVNDLGTQRLASAALGASVKRFVFTSTGLVYGSNGGRLAREDDPCAPTAAYPVSKLAAERFLLGIEGLDVRVLRLPFVYGDGDPHVREVLSFMRGFPPSQRMAMGHHADVAQAVERVLDTASPAHRVYNVVDDEAPDLATLFASEGAPPPDGSNAEYAGTFDALLDGRRIREDLGFAPKFPRFAAGA